MFTKKFTIFVICIYKVVISVLFVCPIITHEPLKRFASNFDLGTQENSGNVLGLGLKLSGSTVIGKKLLKS